MTDLQVKLRLYCCYATNEQQNGVQMQRRVKLALGVVVLAGFAFAQWKYGAGQQLLNLVHPQQQTTTGADASTANQKAPAAGAKRAAIPIAVKLAAAAPKDFPLIERSYGTMASPQIVTINARIASQITEVKVQEGQYVKKGDILIVLDDRTLQATLAKDEATLAKDQAVLANNDIQLQRAQTLAARNAGNLADVDNAIAAQKSTLQVLDADKAVIDADKLQLEFAMITAPFDGKLGTIAAVPGALVTANNTTGTGLMTITQMKPLKSNFRLPEQVLPALRSKMADSNDPSASNITVRVYASGGKELLDTGRLSFIDSSVDASSGTIAMAADVGNDKFTLWPGERVGVEVEYGTIAGAVTIPAVAVQQGQLGSFVWLVDDQNKVKATPVKVSRYEGNDAAISEGVSLGQQVVIEGQAKLTNGAEVRVGKPGEAQSGAKATDAKTTNAKPQAASGAEAATPDTSAKGNAKSSSGDQPQ